MTKWYALYYECSTEHPVAICTIYGSHLMDSAFFGQKFRYKAVSPRTQSGLTELRSQLIDSQFAGPLPQKAIFFTLPDKILIKSTNN